MGEEFQDPYVLPGTLVLKNRLNITDGAQLEAAERQFVAARALGSVPMGQFDLKHLRAIHRHLFQDVYPWAGEVRTVNISKGQSVFQAFAYIETGMAHVHSVIRGKQFLRGLPAALFANQAAAVMSDLNYCHPFREGNGRTQLEFLRQLSDQAGHPFHREELDAAGWIEASQEAMRGNNSLLARQILRAIRVRAGHS